MKVGSMVHAFERKINFIHFMILLSFCRENRVSPVVSSGKRGLFYDNLLFGLLKDLQPE
jgi:hypothetical protein